MLLIYSILFPESILQRHYRPKENLSSSDTHVHLSLAELEPVNELCWQTMPQSDQRLIQATQPAIKQLEADFPDEEMSVYVASPPLAL